MKWIEINKRGNKTILNVDKIIEIKTFEHKEQFDIFIYYQFGQSKECIGLSYINESLRKSTYDRLKIFLLSLDENYLYINNN